MWSPMTTAGTDRRQVRRRAPGFCNLPARAHAAPTGTPTDSTAYECIDAVYDHITDSGICTDPGRQLVIYGQSSA